MNVPPKGNLAFRLGAYFETLKVSQQPVPNLTVRIAEGAFWAGGTTLVEFAGGNTATMVPPGAGLAVWVLVALTANASVQLVYGVPAATNSPPAPAVPAGFIPLAFVYLTTGMTQITNDMIFDERPLWVMQTSFVPLAGGTMTGPLILNGNPTAVNGAATKGYVDTQDALHPSFTDLNNGLATKADIAGTPSDTFVLNSDWVGAPSTNVFFGVDRGSQPNTYIRWNEGTDLWELTNDGTTYSPIANTAALGAYLPLAGGTMLGALTLFADPAAPLQAATKQYTDAQILAVGNATYVAKAGSTMTGVLVHPAGTAANPTVVFGADVTTGFYSIGAGEIDVAVAGVKKVSFSAAGVTVFSGFFTPGTGGAAAPEHTFTNDATTGMYRVGAAQLGIACGGVNAATFSATGMAVAGNISATGGLSVTGPATAALDMGAFKVVNMGTPTVGTDAATKAYVDAGVATKVNKTDTLALTGDVTVPASALTGPANSFVATLANTAVTPGVYGDATHVSQVTIDAKGRVTAAANVLLSSGASLSGLTAAIVNHTLANGDFDQTWNWSMTTDATSAMTFGETVAAVNGSGTQNLVQIKTLAGSTANPFVIFQGAEERFIVDNSGLVAIQGSGNGGVDITVLDVTVSGNPGGTLSLSAGAGLDAGDGGTLSITGGSTGGTGASEGGSVSIQGGSGFDTANGGDFNAQGGSVSGTGSSGSAILSAGNQGGGNFGGPGTISAFGVGIDGNGGDIYLQSGNANTDGTIQRGGIINIAAGIGGDAGTSSNGGSVTIAAGAGGNTTGTRAGGAISVTTGSAGTGGNTNGGDLTFGTGVGDGTAAGGNTLIQGGTGGITGDGGHIYLNTGDAGAGGGLGAQLHLDGGHGTNTTSAGGAVSLIAGDSSAGTPGQVHIKAGGGGNPAGLVLIEGGTPTDGAGGIVTVQASNGVSATTGRNGGNLNLRSGNAGGSTLGFGNGGQINIISGNSVGGATGGGINMQAGSSPFPESGNGGGITISAGSSTNITPGTLGGNVTIQGGGTSSNGGTGGQVGMFAGSGLGTGGAGGPAVMHGGSGSVVGGLVELQGGQGAQGGAVTITGGTGLSSDGGGITVTTGTGAAANGGNFQVITGDGSGLSGLINLSTGTSTGVGGTTGAVNIITGGGSGTNTSVGVITMTTGNATGNGTAGAITLIGGGSPTGIPGGVSLSAGNASNVGSAQDGGFISLSAGHSLGSGVGGFVEIQAGTAFGTGLAGQVTITGGSSNAVGIAGGTVVIRGGQTVVDTDGGAVQILGRNAGLTSNGGAVTLTGGDGGGNSGNGGTVRLQGGTVATTGTDTEGNVALGAGNTSTARKGDLVYVPSATGTPTGTPAAIAGLVPMLIDTVASKLWAYIGGAWVSVTLA